MVLEADVASESRRPPPPPFRRSCANRLFYCFTPFSPSRKRWRRPHTAEKSVHSEQIGHAIRSLDVPFLYRDFGIVIINAIDTEVKSGAGLLSYIFVVASPRASKGLKGACNLHLKKKYCFSCCGFSGHLVLAIVTGVRSVKRTTSFDARSLLSTYVLSLAMFLTSGIGARARRETYRSRKGFDKRRGERAARHRRAQAGHAGETAEAP